ISVSLYISVGESSTIRMRAMVFPIRNYNGPSQDSGYLFARHEIRHVGLDRTQQFFLAEWFGEVLIGAHDPSLGLVEQAVLGREHDHRRGFEGAVVLDQRAGLIAVQA